eukprot:TRINITY_DN2015_c0_g1_i1.p1 TRINITY_DN2015_c0_g1~~TRINITY_DN2015_c0_g1_i1.p1  ORF type:complete len:122 (-),score=24.56 TRINITY_DN2015_c0_g1_i1:62-373(-)
MAVVMALGGAMGYAKSRSTASLVAGVASGSLFALSGYLIENGRPLYGHELAGVVSVLLTATMGRRALRTGKIMPAGAIAALNLAHAAYQWTKVNQMFELGHKN